MSNTQQVFLSKPHTHPHININHMFNAYVPINVMIEVKCGLVDDLLVYYECMYSWG